MGHPQILVDKFYRMRVYTSRHIDETILTPERFRIELLQMKALARSHPSSYFQSIRRSYDFYYGFEYFFSCGSIEYSLERYSCRKGYAFYLDTLMTGVIEIGKT